MNILSPTKRAVIFAVLVVSMTSFFLGFPQNDDSLVSEVNEYALKITEVYHGSEEDKTSFSNNGFCTDGTLEQLSLRAQDLLRETILVENLSRDCVVVLDSIKS